MISQQNIKRLVYAMVILLSLAVLALAVAAPATFRSSKVVYQGF